MKRLTPILLSLLFISTTAFAQLKANDYEWMKSIRKEHPRMFFTNEDISLIEYNAMLFDAQTYTAMQRRLDRIFKKGLEQKEGKNDSNPSAALGYRASDAAMLWAITKEKRYLDLAKMLLGKVIDNYELRVSKNLYVSGQAFPVISALCAYDWIYNDLTIEERAAIGTRLYKATYDVAWHGDGLRKKRSRENVGGPKTSFSGSAVLPWYIGLTFYGEGIDDEECLKMLRSGYDQHQQMTAFRAKMLGKSGGFNSGTISSGFEIYPYAEINFIYSFMSATGVDIVPQMSYMMGYLSYLDWMCLPGNREFGIGDSNHYGNKLPRRLLVHIKEIANLMVKHHPKKFNWFSSLVARYNDGNTRPSTMSFLPLLHRYHFDNDEAPIVTDAPNKQSKRFGNLGHIVMRSGLDDRDTYAVFLTERRDRNRQHYDLNHFVIYKNGFRALDSGARPQPGIHTSHYYGRTVAHNCVTIYMPGEKLPKYWGKPAKHEINAPVPNDGGQRVNKGGKLLAYKENRDYVYIASDATKCYHPNKAEQVVREFIWIKPDIFVVYDRVVSDKPEYDKRWLYHTASEPIMNGKMEFSEVSQGGKSICRTLLPTKAVVELVGGDGKQFWSDGKNWPIPEYRPEQPMYKRSKNTPNNKYPLVGQWRVEVSPKKVAATNHFLHIIQVGDESLKALPQTTCKDGKEAVTLQFDYDGKHYSLVFDKTQRSGCNITVTKQ